MSTVADVAVAVSELITKIVQIYDDAKQGAIDPRAALDRIGTLHTRLADDNATADAILNARFPDPLPSAPTEE